MTDQLSGTVVRMNSVNVPASLQDCKLVGLDMGALMRKPDDGPLSECVRRCLLANGDNVLEERSGSCSSIADTTKNEAGLLTAVCDEHKWEVA